LKIQKACQLLDFTDKKAKEIAFELAFNDPYYFSKVFTKYMHMSPKEYRMKKKG
jgi:AraC-like DNA-binding protein